MKTTTSGTLHLTTVVTLAFVSTLLPAGMATAQGPQLDDARADALIADIEAQAAEAEVALQELASIRIDPDAIVRDVGTDPRALRDHVAQETRWVPYVGALGGAEGVLMDGQGSGLDRALLLAELLTRAGHDARLMRTSLPADVAERLAMQALERSSATAVEEVADETRARRESVIAAADELERLLDLDGRPAMDRPPSAADSMSDHWWVRAGDGGDVIDLDIIFGDDDADRPAATASMAIDAVPPEMRHAVTVRVVIERLDADGLTEETVLEHRIPLGGPAHRSVDLRFVPAPDQGEVPDEDLATLDIAAFPYWRPVIEVDGEDSLGEWFDARGRLEGPGQVGAGDALGDASSALGALGGEDDPDPTSRLTGVWIEYASEGPAGMPRIERRELYDTLASLRGGGIEVTGLLDDETLADSTPIGLALLGDTSILIAAASLDESTLLEAFYRDVIDSRSGRIALVSMAARREDERIGPSIAQTRPRPIPLMVMSLLRAWWSADPGRTFAAEPIVLSTRSVVPPDGAMEEASIITDIVFHHMGVLGDGQDAGRIRMRQGMLDTSIESVLADERSMPNAWDRFAHPGNAESWLALGDATDLDAITASIPEGDRARIRRSLEEGNLVALAPTARQWAGTPYADWWRVEPDESTLGLGFRGWGAQIIERSGIRGGESLAAYEARMQAIQICHRFNLAATAMNVYLIQVELHAGRGLRPPRPPRGLTARYRCPFNP